MPYNAKVDVFAATLVIYQVFAQLNVASQFQNEADAYNFAQRVCNGHRPQMPKKFPKPLIDLLAAGWAERPEDRPTAAQLLARLRRFEESDAFQEIAGHRRTRCCCLGA